ncbi:MAG TPA: DNA primase [Symbiobacteriaceae bacterium]|nr:DNA primase [Symbiobacteriaceae bacterium]
MALFDQAFIDEVRAKTDIVEVISSYVKLERRGNRHVGLCPFHGEKTPSFHVIPHMQIYHCFGCKASGDVIKFLQERDHLSFYEAMVQLAHRARIPLPKQERTPEEEKAYRERREMYDALEFSARFFHHQLHSTDPGKVGLDYLLRRGLTDETIRTFRLGWAPGYGRLYQSARSRFPTDVLQRVGLVIPRREGSGFMDAFFDRVMFPITDLNGRVIGFGGRILDGGGPKYKNTSDTPLFSKRNVLFGLAQAKDAIRAQNQAILVEGYMDVIMPHQVGVKNVVAPLGTALTEEQCKLLRQQAEQVIVAFDSDTAGQMATLRSLDVLYETGCDVRILNLPDGKDPDEFIRVHGVEGFRRCIAEAIPLVEFKLQRALARYPQGTPEAKAKGLEAVAQVLADLNNDVLREEYTHRVANELAGSPMDVGELKRAIDRQMNRLLRQGFQHNQPNSRDNSRDLGSTGTQFSPREAQRPVPKGSDRLSLKLTRDDLTWRAERTLIHLLLEYPGFLARVEQALGDVPFEDPVHKRIYSSIMAVARPGSPSQGPVVAQLLDTLVDGDARAVLVELAANRMVSAHPEQEAAHCIEKIMEHRDSRRIADLENQMQTNQATGQPLPASLIEEWTQLQRKRKKPLKS